MSRMPPRRTGAFFVAALLAVGFAPAPANACTEPRPPAVSILAAQDTTRPAPIPRDAPIVVAVAVGVESFAATATSNGTTIELVTEKATDVNATLVRAASGSFPDGPLALTITYGAGGTTTATETAAFAVSGSIADYRPSAPTLTVEMIGAPGAETILCSRPAQRNACIDPGDREIATRAVRLPKLSVTEPFWPKTLFQIVRKWSVKHADGSVKETLSPEDAVLFDAPGVEYCLDVDLTPLYGIALEPRHERLCVPNGDARYDVQEDEHVSFAARVWQQLGCDGPLPIANSHEQGSGEPSGASGDSGCAVATVGNRPNDTRSCSLIFGLVVAAAGVATRRRVRRG